MSNCCTPLSRPNLHFIQLDGSAPVTNRLFVLPFPCNFFVFQWPTVPVIAAWMHWDDLSLDGDENDLISALANGIYVGLPGGEKIQSAAVGTPVAIGDAENQAVLRTWRSPFVKFSQPINEFKISGWGRGFVDLVRFELDGTIVCSDGIEDICSWPIGNNT